METSKTDHKKLLADWLKIARLAVRQRDWLRASDYYRSAAFHSHILKALKAK